MIRDNFKSRVYLPLSDIEARYSTVNNLLYYDIVKYICPKDIESLSHFVQTVEKFGIKQMSEIVIPTKSGKSRKFGLEKSRRVFETLGIPYEEPKK